MSSAPASWRLVNLALGLSSLLGLTIAVIAPSLLPTNWLLSHWVSTGSLQGVPTLSLLVLRLGINLWLPASVLLGLFSFLGLHKKLDAPLNTRASLILTLSWILYIAGEILPRTIGAGEGASALFFVVGIYMLFLAPIFLLLAVLIGFSAAQEILVLRRYATVSSDAKLSALLAWVIIPPVVSLLPIIFGSNNPLAVSTKEDSAFANLCNGVGVRLMERPVSTVRSIAYDWNPQRMNGRPDFERIELDGSGLIRVLGCCSSTNSSEADKKVSFEFTESRPDHHSGPATINPSAPYYHFPGSHFTQPYFGVDAISADAIAFFDVDDPNKLKNIAPRMQGAIRYQLTLTDRRSGAILGIQSYVLDRINGRACGINIDSAISQGAFIYDAINR